MIILEIHIENAALVAVFEAKRHAPVPTDRHGEASGSISAQSVKSTSPAQIANTGCAIYRVEDQAHAFMKLGPYPPRSPGAENLFDTLMLE